MGGLLWGGVGRAGGETKKPPFLRAGNVREIMVFEELVEKGEVQRIVGSQRE